MIFPNRENIDRWLFDYTEGNLSADQETILENYILQNPDLEVDLDAWNESKLVSEEFSIPNKDNYKKRRRYAPFYFSSIALLLIIGIFFIFNSSRFENKNSENISKNSSRKREYVKQNFVQKSKLNDRFDKLSVIYSQVSKYSKSKISDEKYKESYPSINKQKINHFDLTLNSSKNRFPNLAMNQYSYNSNGFVANNSNVQEYSFASKQNEWKLSLKRIDLKSLKLENYQIRNEDLQISESENSNNGLNLDLGDIKIFQKIGKVLEKDLGLSNFPDHTYSIPEYSNVDVLFSNIGATSQIRFQSTSMARWIENIDQRKFSQQITLDGYSRDAQSAFGLQANYDYFANGSIQNWNTCMLFSPKVALTRSVSIEPAFRLKIGNKLLNEDRITNHSLVNYENQTVNQFNFDSTIAIGSKLWYRDLDFGLTINTPYFYIGGQVSNILRHQNNIYSNYENMDLRAKNVYNAIIGTQYISRNQKIQFSPYCFFERINSNRFFGGFSLKIDNLLIGGSYGTGKIASGTIGLSFKNFALYGQSSYGFSSAINTHSFIHQLTVRFNSNVDKKSRRHITF